METAVIKPLQEKKDQKETVLQLTPRFEEALVYATQLHAKQQRRTTKAPYISHLMGVASIVMNMPYITEDEVIAALLHDSVEDQGQECREEIKKRFGNHVVNLIDECTNPPIDDWRKRKQYAITMIKNDRLSQSALQIRLADKLHNAQSLSNEIDIFGPEIINRFHGGKEGTLWYYKEIVEAFKKTLDKDLKSWGDELEKTVQDIEEKLGLN